MKSRSSIVILRESEKILMRFIYSKHELTVKFSLL